MSDQSYQLTLVSHPLCPFVQRAAVALNEMQVLFERKPVDLKNKPDWFNEISPLGKVPVLVVDNDSVIFESNVIAEFANDVCNGALLSDDKVERAQQRAWVEFAGATMSNVSSLYNCKEKHQFDEALETLQKKWQQLEAVLPPQGFFNGEHFTLVDCAFAPSFRYFDILEQFGDWQFVPPGSKVAQYRETLKDRPAVQNAVAEDYMDAMVIYLAAKNSWMGRLISKELPM